MLLETATTARAGCSNNGFQLIANLFAIDLVPWFVGLFDSLKETLFNYKLDLAHYYDGMVREFFVSVGNFCDENFVVFCGFDRSCNRMSLEGLHDGLEG